MDDVEGRVAEWSSTVLGNCGHSTGKSDIQMITKRKIGQEEQDHKVLRMVEKTSAGIHTPPAHVYAQRTDFALPV